jgi:hypothetical protein
MLYFRKGKFAFPSLLLLLYQTQMIKSKFCIFSPRFQNRKICFSVTFITFIPNTDDKKQILHFSLLDFKIGKFAFPSLLLLLYQTQTRKSKIYVLFSPRVQEHKMLLGYTNCLNHRCDRL